MKRKVLMVISFIFAIITALAIFAACGETDAEGRDSGAEAGTYYCDYNGTEYTLLLGENGKCTFTLTMDGTPKTGGYELAGETLSLTPNGGDAISASYRDEKITFSYSNVTYTFLRKIEYTVKFDTDGGTTITDQKVVNGRTATKPQTPTRNDEVFVGWYTDEAQKSPFYFTQPITKDMTLHARYVDKIDPEYKVSFDLGYEGAVAPAPVETVGNKVYVEFIDAPVWADHEFLGWYYSDFENREELTAQFTSDMTVKQDMTLYAVWKDNAPVVSVASDGVSISAAGTNATYNLKITAPDGTETTASAALATGSTTVYRYNFAEKAEGKYKVEVEVNGQMTTRYYNNKALARVSVFEVVNRTLQFNEVENATDYKITVICGTKGHEHNEVSLGQDANGKPIVSFDFSECDMPAEGGIRFIVKATAENYAPSVSEEYEFTATLDAVKNIEYDAATGIVTWARDYNATSYKVTVICDQIAVVENEEVITNSYSVKNVSTGAIEVRITPVAFGWKSPAAATYTFTKQSLAAPTNVQFKNGVVSWDSVEGAEGYVVKIGSKTIERTKDETSYTVAPDDFSSDKVEITVYAVGKTEAERSCESDAITVTREISGLSYDAGVLSWNPVWGYEGTITYEVIDPQGTTHVVAGTSTNITFTDSGTQRVSVRMLVNGNPVGEIGWATLDIEVYTMEFDIEDAQIDPIPDAYLAAGDPITLPEPEWAGYDFNGWFTQEGGEGQQYESTTFAGGDITLHAYFTPHKYTITLVAGANGEWDEQEFIVEYRQSDYTLPVPEPNSVEYTFRGWYRGVGGTGTMFADANGGNTGTYTLLQDLTLYALWITPFTYKNVTGGCSISAGANIKDYTEITLPTEHEGKAVVTVEDFTAGTNLEVINIPNTIKTITLGSIGDAFEGLKKLKAVNIIPVEDNRDPTYASENGMVYTVSGHALVFVPMACVAPNGSTEVTLPQGITTINTGAIYKNQSITKLTIPATVTEVQTQAIVGHTSTLAPTPTVSTLDKLTEIVFEENTADGATLTIADEAFYLIGSLTKITLPKYVADFSSAKFDSRLVNVTMVNVTNSQAGDAYFSVDGVLCRTVERVQEIAYYPAAKENETYEFPAGVTSIGDAAFKKATNLTSITIPATITHIGESAFEGCSGIVDIQFRGSGDSNDLTIEDSAFSGTKAKQLTIPANVIKVGWHAFYISTLTKVTLMGKPNMSVDYAAQGVFYITDIDLKIGANFPAIDLASVFASKGTTATAQPTAPKIKSIDISENTNYVRIAEGQPGYGGIYNAEKTKLLYIEEKTATFAIPEGVTEISSVIFKGNTVLRTLTIPASVTTISEYAFQGCSSLGSVTFSKFTAPAGTPDAKRGALTIGKSAFSGCNSLSKITVEGGDDINTLPAETIEIGDSAFNSCSGLQTFTIPGKVQRIGEKAFAQSALVRISFEEGITSLAEGVFSNCNSLTEVNLPASIEIIGDGVFSNCASLESINVAEGNKHFQSVDGALYEARQRPESTEIDAVTLIAVPVNSTGGENNTLHIPATVTKVATRAMQNNVGIERVEFAEKVIDYDESGAQIDGKLTIDTYAFCGSSTSASRLTEVILPLGVEKINDYAFQYRSRLQSINLPYTITSIGKSVFSGCNQIAEMIFDDTPAAVDEDNEDEEDETVGVKLSLDSMALSGMSGLLKVVLPERPEVTIKADTFSSSTSLREITLPTHLKGLPHTTSGTNKGTFENFVNLTTVHLPKEVDSTFTIGYHAFSGCRSLTGIGEVKNVMIDGVSTPVSFLPEGITTIGNGAFASTALKTIGFPASFSTIVDNTASGTGRQVFTGCSQLETIVFADNCALEELPIGFVTKAYSLKHVVFGKNSHIKTFGAPNSSTVYESTFEGAASLESIVIPASVETICKNAFKNLTGLKSITFESGSKLSKVEDSAFATTAITAFTFPEVTDASGATSAIEVGAGLFNGCFDLTSVTLSASVQNIGTMFTGAAELRTVIAEENKYYSVDNDQKTIYSLNEKGERDSALVVWGEVSGRLVVPEGTVEIPANLYKAQSGITEVVLPASLVRIGAGAFENCTNLTKVTFAIPQGKTSALSLIDNTAFKNCSSLSEFEFEKAVNLNRISKEAFYGCALTKLDLRNCVRLNSNATGTSLNGIGESAFQDNTKLGTKMINPADATANQYAVMFPNSIKTIEAKAFRNTALMRIDLSNTAITSISGSTSNGGVFNGCAQLKEVKLPVKLTAINAGAFQDTGLEKINLNELVNLTAINASAFNNTQLTEIVLPAAPIKTTTQGNIFSNNEKLQRVDMSAIKTANIALGSSTFANCPLLEEVKLPVNLNAIGNSMFSGCTSLTDITIPDSVKKIGTSAFLNCTSLTELKFPEGLTSIDGTATNKTGAFIGTSLVTADFSQTELTSIGGYTFQNVATLKTVKFSEKIETMTLIGNYAFQGTGITSVDLPASIKSLSVRAFQGCAELTTVTYQAPALELGTGAFRDCTSLSSFDFSRITKTGSEVFWNTGFTELTFPSNTITWGTSAFKECLELRSVTVPEEVTAIPQSAFEGCTALKTVTIKSPDLTSIASSAFWKCAALDTVIWPETLDQFIDLNQNVFRGTAITSMDLSKMTNLNFTKINSNAFQDCLSLERVILPENVAELAQNAFNGCVALRNVNTEHITKIGSSAFKGCTALKSVDISGATTLAANMLQDCTEITEITLNDAITAIPNFAFAGCTSLATIHMDGSMVTKYGNSAFNNTGFTTFAIGSALAEIGDSTFQDCAELTGFTVDPENGNFEAGTNGELYLNGTSGKTLVFYPAAASEIALEDDVAVIAAYAFATTAEGIGAGKTLTLPASVRTINQRAFKGLALDKLIISDGVESFASYSLSENSIKEIEFLGSVDALNTAGFNSSNIVLFSNDTELTKVTFPEGLKVIGGMWFDGCTALKSFEIPASVTRVEASAFRYSGITSLTVPETVTALESSTFAYMSDLREVTYLAKIADTTVTNLFANDTALETVKFGPETPMVGENWFSGVSSLTKVVAIEADGTERENALPNSVTYLGACAFKGTGISEITLPTVGEGKTLSMNYSNNGGVFTDCVNLKHIVIPDGVLEIPYQTFLRCTALEWVKISDTVSEIGGQAFMGCTDLKFVNIPNHLSKVASGMFQNSDQVHVFVPKTAPAFLSGYFWYPTETNHLYFESSEPEVVLTRGLAWIKGTALTDNIHFNATYEQALKASGVTDFPTD